MPTCQSLRSAHTTPPRARAQKNVDRRTGVKRLFDIGKETEGATPGKAPNPNAGASEWAVILQERDKQVGTGRVG